MIPYESAERRADPKISLKYLISGQRIANDFEQFRSWWLKYAKEKDYRAIVVIYNGMVVGFASLQIKRNSKRQSGVISEFLVDMNYPSVNQLLHKILYTCEQLSRHYQCTETIVQAYQIDEDTIRDLDYRRVHNKDCFYFRKKPHEI